MKKIASAIAVIAGVTAVFLFALYIGDRRSVEKAGMVVARLNEFCARQGALPDRAGFLAMFPEFTNSSDWFYWPNPEFSRATIQYPMTAVRRGAPGRPKTSEFTATTYAYTITITCLRL